MASHIVVQDCSYLDAVEQLVVVHAVVEVGVVHHLTVHAGELITGSLDCASSLGEVVMFENVLVYLFLALVSEEDLVVPVMHNLSCHSTMLDVLTQKPCQMTSVEVVEVHSAR